MEATSTAPSRRHRAKEREKTIGEWIERLARERGVTPAQVLRDALSVDEWIREVLREGGEILIDRNGRITKAEFDRR